MIVYDVVTKVLGREEFPKHNIADPNSGITGHYIYCFVQSGEAFTVRGNKHMQSTHT